MSQVDVDSGIENMEVEDSDRREKRNLTEKVGQVNHAMLIQDKGFESLSKSTKESIGFSGLSLQTVFSFCFNTIQAIVCAITLIKV